MKKTMKNIVGMGLLAAAFSVMVPSISAAEYSRDTGASASGSWNDTKWKSTTAHPDAAGDIVNFSVGAGQARTLSLDNGTYALGILNSPDMSNGSWTLSDGTLLFNNNGNTSQMNLAGVFAVNNVNLQLAEDLIITSSGTRALTLANTSRTSGVGDLYLRNNNTINMNGSGAQAFNVNLTLNHKGWVVNDGTPVGAGGSGAGIRYSGTIGSVVTGIRQNSIGSTLTITSTANLTNFTGQISVVSGTLISEQANFAIKNKLDGHGTLLLNDSSGKILTVASNATIVGEGLKVQGKLTMASGAIYEYNNAAVNVTDTLTLTSGWKLSFADGSAWTAGTAADYITLFEFGTKAAIFDLTNVMSSISGLGFDTSSLQLTVDGNKLNLYGIIAVPEPSTLVLLGVGAGLLAVLRRRK